MIPDFIGTSIIGGMITSIITLLALMAIIIFAIQRNYQLRKMEHDVRLRAIDQGIEVPRLPTKKNKAKYPFTWAFIFIGFGLGLTILYMTGEGDTAALGFGLIIGFIGLGLFASRVYGVKKEELYEMEKNHYYNSTKPEATTQAAPVTQKTTEPLADSENGE